MGPARGWWAEQEAAPSAGRGETALQLGLGLYLLRTLSRIARGGLRAF